MIAFVFSIVSFCLGVGLTFFLFHRRISRLENEKFVFLEARCNNEFNAFMTNLNANQKQIFDKKLKDSYEKACELIKFDEILYKKTITKKRKEYSRKNAHKAKPERTESILDLDAEVEPWDV